MRIVQSLTLALEDQRGHLLPWVPVFFGAGIGAYFLLPQEPPVWVWWGLGLGAGLGALAVLRRPEPWALPVLGLCLVLFGLSWAGLRAELVRAPIIGFRYYGPIEGRIIGIDRSLSDKARMTLDRVVLFDVAPGRTPEKVRVSIHTRGAGPPPAVGTTVVLTGHLSPPQGPVEPGGFDLPMPTTAAYLRLF